MKKSFMWMAIITAVLMTIMTAYGASPIKITKVGLSIAEKDAAYSETVTTNDATLPYVWSIDAGALPAGLTLVDGVISGTPTAYGDYTFKVKVIDADLNEDTKDMTIQVLDPSFWQMHQNTKRHIGTAAVTGPNAFIEKWSFGINLGYGAPSIEGNDIYEQVGSPYLQKKINATTGAEIYTSGDAGLHWHQRGTLTLGTGVDSDKFFICAGGDSVSASYSKADGSVLWSFSEVLGAGNGFQAYSNGRVYDITANTVYAWDVSSIAWCTVYSGLFMGMNYGPPSLFDTTEGEIIVFGSSDPSVGFYGVNVDTGGIGWTIPWGVAWNNNTLGVSAGPCPAIDSTNNCYFGVDSGIFPDTQPFVVSLNGVTGEVNWSCMLLPAAGNATSGNGALSYDQKTFYIQTLGNETPTTGYLYAINTSDGSVKWSFANGLTGSYGPPDDQSLIVDKVGKVYFVYNNGAAYKVACVSDDTTQATLKWEANVGVARAIPRSFSMGDDGTLYFNCSLDGATKLYAVKEAPLPAASFLDMERGSMTLTFTSSTAYSYKIQSSTSAYDYNENNMTWTTEADDLPGQPIFMSWTDANPPTSGAKYYRIATKLAGFNDTLSETVGLMFVQAKTGRNMISSPFEPYPSSSWFLPMNTQVNIGRTTKYPPGSASGDAIYWVAAYTETGSFESDEPEGYTRTHIGPPPGHWYHGPYVDFYLAGLTDDWLDLSAGGTIEFDCRYYMDSGNYADAPIFLVIYTFFDDGTGTYPTFKGSRDYGIVYAVQSGDPPYPTWTHVKVDVTAGTNSGAFDPAKISRLQFYGTDWNTTGNDWIDVKNLKITTFKTPGASTLNKIVGNQLTGHSLNKFLSDNIELWVNASGAYKRAWYKTGTTNSWLDWDTGSAAAFGMDADKGYWFNVITGHAAKNVMFCGRVSKTDRSIPIAIGRNLVGSSFPVSCTLAKSGLVASGFTGHNLNKFLSDNVEFWKNPGAVYERFWYKTGATNAWQPWNTGDPMRSIAAGDSIWVNVLNTHAAFTWTYPVPPRP